MSLEDPYIIVQNEVFDALQKLRNNYTRWKDLQENSTDITREDYNVSVMELKNGIKSIMWDLDELEESLDNSDRQSKLDRTELEKRRNFISQTREEVQSMNEKLTKSGSKLKAMSDFPINFGTQPQNGTKYTRLINAPDASNHGENILFKANFDTEDDNKSPYVPEHSIMFRDTDLSVNVINSHPGRVERLKQLLHLTTERRQWMAFGLIATIFLLIIIVASRN
ncbi:hypothetical protein RDWZM_000770 [Blomia tropicalis]|uniref:Syntaxin 6/10/61 N-terminal domain-containing protein n=1 Tax=Blomia tropicalis TaxID=40697 RepID=A0A9Q0MAH4_BLOTA|nr:hypothetical protein RDWZM_000770 [Blomia tropicalis]